MEEKLNELLQGIFDSLTDEQKEKAQACKTNEELIALAAQEGIELPDEALDAVAGGGRTDPPINVGEQNPYPGGKKQSC